LARTAPPGSPGALALRLQTHATMPIQRAAMMMLSLFMSTALVIAAPGDARAHCDTLDGPVVRAGRKSLDTGALQYALIWVQPTAERELRSAFVQALSVRKLGKEARGLADRFFLETLVRLHRAGEGAPFTGLEPAGHVPPPIAAADRALEAGSLKDLDGLLTRSVSHGLEERFARVREAGRFRPDDVAAGRAYVAAYVDYVHYAERIHAAATGAAVEHEREAAAGEQALRPPARR
jgi:hypothetical protein